MNVVKGGSTGDPETSTGNTKLDDTISGFRTVSGVWAGGPGSALQTSSFTGGVVRLRGVYWLCK